MDAIKAARKTWRKHSRYHEERRNRWYGYGILIEINLCALVLAGIITVIIKTCN